MQLDYSLDNIKEIAKAVWNHIGQAQVVVFHGLVGSGKTTLIHAMCDLKNVKDIVGSPSFSIINEYAFEETGKEKKIYHIDLYRLENEVEAIQAGVEDCLYNDHICLVEWPEKIASLLPDDTVHIKIAVIDEERRRIIIGDK